ELGGAWLRSVLERQEAELIQPPHISERPFADLRDLVDVLLDLAGGFEAELGSGVLHPSRFRSDIRGRFAEHLRAEVDDLRILVQREGAIARADAFVHLLPW